MIIYRLIIAGMSPATTYYMLSDLVFLLVFLCALIIIAGECINAIYKQENTLWFDVMRSATLSLACMVFLVDGFIFFIYGRIFSEKSMYKSNSVYDAVCFVTSCEKKF